MKKYTPFWHEYVLYMDIDCDICPRYIECDENGCTVFMDMKRYVL